MAKPKKVPAEKKPDSARVKAPAEKSSCEESDYSKHPKFAKFQKKGAE